MLEVKTNYKGSYSNHTCPVCLDDTKEDTQKHLLTCEKLEGSDVVSNHVQYDDIFQENPSVQLIITRILMQKFEKRKSILNNKST